MTIFDQLGLEYDTRTHYMAYELVQEVLENIRSDLYESSQLKRVLIYVSMLRQVSLAMLDDGGPTFSRCLIEECLAEVIEEERNRGDCALGPFLTQKQLLYLLQHSKPEGLGWPSGYTEVDKSAI